MHKTPLAGWMILAAALASGAAADEVHLLEDPADAARARVELISGAAREVDALFFLARNDRVSMTALGLLRDAARRGVRTRVLVDANFHHIPRSVLAHLRTEGVEVREYHPLSLRHPTWVARRLHEKLVVADRRRYITGGRNLAEAYFGLTRRNYVDRDVMVEGGSAADAAEHFDRLWSSREVAELRALASARDRARAGERIDQAMRELECGTSFASPPAFATERDPKKVDPAAFIHDPLARDGGTRVGDRVAEIFAAARQSIVIESPYLVPSRAMLRVLERKSREGVYIRIVTNSFRSTDGLLPFAGYLKYRKRLVRQGIDIREFRGPDVLHAKSAVVDGRTVIVGSYNTDQRSHYLDIEGACVIEDRDLARELLDAIEVHAENAWAVDRQGVPPDERRMPRTSFFGLRAAQLFLPIFEGQL